MLSYEQLTMNSNVADAFFASRDKAAPIVFFGAGFALKGILQRFEQKGFTALSICDNDKKKHGRQILGYTVQSLDQVASLPDTKTFVVTSPAYFWEIKEQLETQFGANSVCPVDFNCTHYFSGKQFQPYFTQHIERFKAVEAFLADDLSRQVYRQVLKAHSTGKREDFESIPRVDDDWYLFKSLLAADEDSVYVDCGAFDGDTITLFNKTSKGRYKHIYAFEPDKNILEALAACIADNGIDNVTIIPKGVYNRNGSIGFSWDGVYSAVSESNASVMDKKNDDGIEVVRIDDELKDVPVSIIKMDLEGAELNALKGAKDTIQKHHPKLGICLYHNIIDLLEIPEYIHDIAPDYRIYIRHHSTSCNDTIMYTV
ncbi:MULTISPECIES: FkbM family methyltransferase [unclassified Pseudodesulfovibrio]|uniref:FkbM family methyltransferase n=1 Tax=unclassified Pseudodesulfovibrio TaxID=2661612 RepID=UPI000FEBBF34|nr:MULTISPECIES: FkbM family methyltransferase [unclassified Pseudodesulfovibrio]MCJ2163221.1 FkbM family methyltransferase [Pseudodesulfovibrio sp. S3-i]RWU07204.1 FkbM family methyltransferase [Pseudodesulfovibrio sp. S3]